MKLQMREARQKDFNTIRLLLRETHLPTDAVGHAESIYYVAEDNQDIVGVAAYEFYDDDALLRSVAVRPGFQKSGIGSQIVDFMLEMARTKGVQNVVLLTETAKDFFFKKNFRIVDRKAIENESMKSSPEFVYHCPTTAVCMLIQLRKSKDRLEDSFKRRP